VICLRSPSAHVDHDHETGLFRGVLCFSCNGALGQFQDDPERLRSAADYLEGRGPHAQAMRLELGEHTAAGKSTRYDRRKTPGGGIATPREYHLWRRYGLDGEGLERILTVQKGLCAICSHATAEHIDHDHKTTAVRGVLCPECNTGMGQLRDDPNSLRRAADYIEGLLIREVSTADGGTRLSFTFPDVDPATVRINGWRRHREADAANRRLLAALCDLPGVYVRYRHPAPA
ncbi:MAG TPA: endonuclease VII domain-containing protein, partial [Streptosporangiaceae bacterium]|nr:endonuclease VII domain-containing protein [Streptosporangiaceae bacterium]